MRRRVSSVCENSKMRILDLTTGFKAMWFDKENPLVTFLDIREETKPTVLHDIRNPMPKTIGKDFDLVVFDPPHVNTGKNSNMSKRYGYFTTKEILETVIKGSQNAFEVTKNDGIMCLKWNDHDIKLKKILSLIEPCWVPLFGTHTKNKGKSQTYWVVLKKVTIE